MSATATIKAQGQPGVCLDSPDGLRVDEILWDTGAVEHWVRDGSLVVAIYRHQDSATAALELYREQCREAAHEFGR